jgi:hypothetical protein
MAALLTVEVIVLGWPDSLGIERLVGPVHRIVK